jgi:hypothetical protein
MHAQVARQLCPELRRFLANVDDPRFHEVAIAS